MKKSAELIIRKVLAIVLAVGIIAVLIVVIKLYFLNPTNTDREPDKIESGEEYIIQQANLIGSKLSAKNSQEVLDKLSEGFKFIGLDNAKEELCLIQESEIDGSTIYRYRQMYNKIPVYGHDVIVETNKEGYISIVNGDTVEVSLKNTEPSISKGDAIRAAADSIEISDRDLMELSSAELCIYSEKDVELLVYQIRIGPSVVLIDAVTGNIIISDLGISFDNVVLRGQRGSMSVDVSRDGDDIILEDVSRKITVRSYETEEKRDWTGNIDLYKLFEFKEDHLGDPVRFNIESNDFLSATDALANIERAYDFYSTVLRYRSIDGSGKASINIYDGVEKYKLYDREETSLVNNACSCKSQIYDAGYVFVGKSKKGKNSKAADLDEMVHEYTHMVIKYKSDLNSGQRNQASGINEALADIFGEIAEASYNNGNCDWIHGKRNIANGTNIITKSSKFRNTECHKASGIISHAAYLMWIGGDRSSEMMPINNVNTMAALWMKVIMSLTPNATFSEVRGLVEMIASEMGLESKQLKTIQYAFNEAGISLPTVTVEGNIVDKNGNALSGFYFQIKDTKSGETVFNGVTDTNGHFNGYARETGDAQFEIIEKSTDSNGNEKSITWQSGTLTAPLHKGDNNLGEYKLNEYEILIVGVEQQDEITLEMLKSFVGEHKSKIPYDITTRLRWGEYWYETVNNPRMFGHEGKVLFEIKNDVIIDVFWESEDVRYDELDQIIQDISETTGLKQQELYEDQLLWEDTSDHVEYYIKYHEAPINIGVKKMTGQKGENTAAAPDPVNYDELLSKYSTAVAENWDKGRLDSEKMNYQLSDLGEIGYLIEDLNNDGILELMIGAQNPPYEAFENAVLDMYTLDNGKPKLVFSGTEKVFGYLSDNGILMVIKNGGAKATLYQYDFLDPAKLEFYTTNSVCYDGFYNPDHPWYSDESHSVSYTEEEARGIMASYPIHSIDYASLSS